MLSVYDCVAGLNVCSRTNDVQFLRFAGADTTRSVVLGDPNEVKRFLAIGDCKLDDDAMAVRSREDRARPAGSKASRAAPTKYGKGCHRRCAEKLKNLREEEDDRGV